MKTVYVIKQEGPQYWYHGELKKDLYLRGADTIYVYWEAGIDEAYKFSTETEALSTYKAITEAVIIVPDYERMSKGILIKTDDENETWEELCTIEDL